MAISWDAIVAHASATYPETAASTSYGTPSLKVRGKLLCRLRTEADGALAVRCTLEEKQALVEGDDPAFFTVPHYDGHGYVLVDLNRVDADEILELLDAAWRIAAPARLRKDLDG